jgi:SAM-dependent methyltransferase
MPEIEMTKYYDRLNNRLVFTGKSAEGGYWDKHWQSEDFEKLLKVRNNRFIISNTRRYLPPKAKILEGGCGRGDKMYALFSHGYDVYGVDCAKDTVENINRYAPELKAALGDVRNLQFEDGFFDGYWSLGVIEHFYDGYDPILREAYRVLKKGGYFFVTVPVISWLRLKKVKTRKYPEYNESERAKGMFFQFAFDPKELIKYFHTKNFKLVKSEPIDGIKGLKDEILLLKPILQPLYDSGCFSARIIKKVIDILVRPFTNHVMLFIFKKIQDT